MPMNNAVNARTHEANKFATYSSGGPGGAGSKLTIHVNGSGNAIGDNKSNGSGAAASGGQKLTRAVILSTTVNE